MNFSYDPKCFYLAEEFLPVGTSDNLKQELAQHIQNEIESWLEDQAAESDLEARRRQA